jgi:hypothetical protein
MPSERNIRPTAIAVPPLSVPGRPPGRSFLAGLAMLVMAAAPGAVFFPAHSDPLLAASPPAEEGLRIGKEHPGGLRIESCPADKAKPGLFAIGAYTRTEMPPLPSLYDSATRGRIAKGPNELIGRLPDTYAPLQIMYCTRKGNDFAILVALAPKKPAGSNYIWGELPRDLPAGRYHVELTACEYEERDGQLLPAPKTKIRAFYQLECYFAIGAAAEGNAAWEAQGEAVDKTFQALAGRLKFLETEVPKNRQSDRPKLFLSTQRTAAGEVTAGSIQFQYNWDLGVPRKPPAPGTVGLAVFVNAFRRGPWRARDCRLVNGPVVWDGKCERRQYFVDETEFGWRVTVTVEGNQPGIVKKVNGVIDEALTRLSALLAKPAPAPTTQTATRPDEWHLVARNAMASVQVQKMLYDQGPQSYFFIRVRVTNIGGQPMGVDLRDDRKVIYPNQWGDLPKPQREEINERRRQFPPITAAWDARLVGDFKAGRLVRLEPGQSVDYYRDFNNTMGGRPAGADYTFISLDGELDMADGTGAARITCETYNTGRALEGVVDTDVYLPPEVQWARIPAGALVVTDGKVAGVPATQPALEQWSEPVDGLRARIDASRYLTPRLGMEVDVMFKEVAHKPLAIDFDELRALPWKVIDASGKEVQPAKVGKAQPAPNWQSLTSGAGTGRMLGTPKNNRNGRLEIGLYEWTLQPGRYSIRCLLNLRSDVAGNRTSATPWRGQVELPPAEFEVIGEVSDKDLIEAGKKVRAAYPAGGLAMWRALAELVRPGMTVQQMHLALPPLKASVEGGILRHSAMTVWNGNAFFCTYWLDDVCTVEASGVGDAWGSSTTNATSHTPVDMLLTGTPRVKDRSRGGEAVPSSGQDGPELGR